MISLKKIKEELETSQNPLFFFHDDPDGLCSFLLFYKHIKEGHGVIIKTTPNIDNKFLRKVNEFNPDKIFILDIAMVEQEFIDKAKRPIFWIDHHDPQKKYNVNYYNPRKTGKDYYPATKVCYDILKENLWLAMVGCIGDWYIPEDIIDKFIKKYPSLLSKKYKDPGKVYFETELGKLVRLFSFVLKGNTHDAMTCVKILTRIKEPKEILEGTTSAGKFILKKFKKINAQYEELIQEAEKQAGKEKILLYRYYADKMSFSGDLANELTHKYPDKVVFVCRQKSGELKCSIRSKKIKLPKKIKRSIQGLDAMGGGHEYACGAVINIEDFDLFLKRFRKELQ